MRDQKKSVSIDQKLSKAKSNFKKIERRLNDWEEELGLRVAVQLIAPGIKGVALTTSRFWARCRSA